MSIIKATLFKDLEFRLEASEPDVQFLKESWDVLAIIAPFILNITVLPSAYNFDLDLRGFRELSGYLEDEWSEGLDPITREVMTYEGTQWNGTCPKLS